MNPIEEFNRKNREKIAEMGADESLEESAALAVRGGLHRS